MANSIRFSVTVVGKAARRDGNVTDVTFQFTGGNRPNGVQQFIQTMDNSLAASFTIGQACWFYIAPTSADKTAIEGATTVTKSSTKD